jgi:ATP-binding cassette subfamily B multidrug efflux pump
VIAIAHRLSTIARMDRLVVLDQGRIVEQGTHDELLRLGGHYALLWKHQSGGFLPDQGTGAGLPGHVSVDAEAIADDSARPGTEAAAQASAAETIVEPAPALR